MAEHFGYEVVKLERVRIMNIKLKGLPIGEWRDLTPEEFKEIKVAIENSSSVSPKKPKSKSNNPSTKKKAAKSKKNPVGTPSPFASKGERKKHFLAKKKFKNNGKSNDFHKKRSGK